MEIEIKINCVIERNYGNVNYTKSSNVKRRIQLAKHLVCFVKSSKTALTRTVNVLFLYFTKYHNFLN